MRKKRSFLTLNCQKISTKALCVVCIQCAFMLFANVSLGNIIPSQKDNGMALQQDQQKVVTGKVVDENGKSIPGVTVMVKGTLRGVSTNGDGEFSIEITSGSSQILVFSFIGMVKQEIQVSGDKPIKVVMKEDVSEIEEVVVTGIFNRKKEGFTGSANQIKGEELKKISSGNVLKAIQMLDPGFIMNESNMTGSNPNSIPDFQMRGQANMGDYSTDSDVVLRGDISTRPNQPLFVLDGIIGVDVTKIMDMDPEQIESITLLKDAAAMVIYGSKASNGVVVVETKAPARGKLRVSYNGNYKLQVPDLNVYNLLEAKEKLQLEYDAGIYDDPFYGTNVVTLAQQYKHKLLEVERGVNTYWLSQPVRTAFIHRHGVNLEGGDNSLRYKIYLGMNEAPGVMKKTGVSTKSGSVDIRYRYKNLSVSNIIYVDWTVGDRLSPYGSFSQYAEMNPYYRIYDENTGELLRVLEKNYDPYYQSSNALVLNPMYNTLFKYKNQSKAFDVKNTFKVEWLPIDNLRLNMDLTIGKTNQDVDIFKSSNHTDFDGKAVEDKGSYTWTNSKNDNVNFSVTANYNKLFASKHLFSVFLRYDINQTKRHYVTDDFSGFPNENMDEVYLGAKHKNTSGDEGTDRSLGFVGTVNYAFMQKYSFDFSARIDASSEFGRNNRFAPFWSAGLRWNMEKEKWLKNSSFIKELVLRATYGITGSQGFSPYQSLQMYSYRNTMQIYHSFDVVGTVLSSMGNPDLKWQKTDSYNLGLDFNLFNNIVSGRFEYYYKYTKNTLLDYSLAPSVGFSSITDNMGNISNEGYEGTLRIMPYNNIGQRLNFNFVFTCGYNKNTIKKISNALQRRNQESIANTNSRPLPRYEEGYSQSQIWVVKSLGIDPANGNEIFVKRNGEMTYVYDAVDQVPFGDTQPKLQGSVMFNLNWKGWSLSVANRYHFGGQLYNRTLIDKVENADIRYNVDRRALTDRWKKEGDEAFFKTINVSANGSGTKASSRFVMDDNEFSIGTINLQHRFESKYAPFLKKAGLSSASVGLYIEDIAKFSSIKMERGIDYPFARSVSMSVSLVF